MGSRENYGERIFLDLEDTINPEKKAEVQTKVDNLLQAYKILRAFRYEDAKMLKSDEADSVCRKLIDLQGETARILGVVYDIQSRVRAKQGGHS